MKHYLNGMEFAPTELQALLDQAIYIKKQTNKFSTALQGYSIVGLFEKPSLRTRVSFEIGLHRLGAQAIYLDHQQDRIGVRESTADYARNLSVWAHGIFARVYQHETLTELSHAASVPVVNALCEKLHPCQALADAMTLQELFGSIKNIRVAYVGDGNNVCHSLMLIVAALGGHMTVCTPPERAPSKQWIEIVTSLAQGANGSIQTLTNTQQMGEQDVLYTDTWFSMGSSGDKNELVRLLSPFQINMALVQQTNATHVMHCQPAHRDQEISAAVIDQHMSVVLRQAENRLHAQNALWLKLFNKI